MSAQGEASENLDNGEDSNSRVSFILKPMNNKPPDSLSIQRRKDRDAATRGGVSMSVR